MNKESFIKQIEAAKALNLETVNNDAWRNTYHIEAPIGWINDPNGLCYFKGEYHVFYQYSPLDAKGGLKFWGHYTSKDLVNWTEHEIALYPDTAADIDGVYSGSALIHNDEMYLFYTGNVKHEGDYDYILTGREQNVIMVKSTDGYHFSDKKVLLKNSDYPSNMGQHVRDPKVWSEDGIFYMVLGARTVDDLGAVLLYKSTDLNNWTYVSTPAGHENDMGFMWECPDLLQVDEERIFIFSPQGMEPEGLKYQNVYQCGYAMASLNEDKKVLNLGKFEELDRGFDFYAPQTFEAPDGRVMMFGWVGVPDAHMHVNPTVENGWQHSLTIPRVLSVKNNKLYQTPAKELEIMRQNEMNISSFELDGLKTVEMVNQNAFELIIDVENAKHLKINFRQNLGLSYENNVFTLTQGEAGYGRDERACTLETLEQIRIFSDSSCIEIYLNHGSEVFTTRQYDSELNPTITLQGEATLSLTKWDLNK